MAGLMRKRTFYVQHASRSRIDDRVTGQAFKILSQYVSEVLDFSSQYGSETSISYTAYNLAGKPSNYPDYGDFPQAFVMKTYGDWWRNAPSCPIEYMPQNEPDIASHDYVDVGFEIEVYPKEVQVYETYNPGAVVRIWAYSEESKKKWALLFEGKPKRLPNKSRIFSPPLKSINFKTRIIRLEFNHSRLDYHTAIDAVLLVGVSKPESPIPGATPIASLTQQVLELKLHNIPFKKSNDLTKVLSEYEKKTCNDITDPCGSAITLESLPHETLLKILGYLDIRTLNRVAQVSKAFYELATDPMLFSRLSLRPYSTFFFDAQLISLSYRCRFLQRLDLSWCGSYGLITAEVFCNFVTERCSGLTHLRLNCCKFVVNAVMKAIAQTCPKLRELGLRNCALVTEAGFVHLTELNQLRWLDLYRTKITGNCLVPILTANPDLQHLNIGSCTDIVNVDDVARTLGQFNRALISLDMWKTLGLTQEGVRALSRCSQLQELDLGWCLSLSVPVESLTSIAEGCPHLRKLFLTALRGVCDKDLEPFITNCPNLEQIDLLGVHSVTADLCLRLLMHLEKLRFLDLSFCYQINSQTVVGWRRIFPHVSIKRSAQAPFNSQTDSSDS